ncbi:MAG: cytochrome P450 [Alphaproteobacteria bacterium]|nr:MAG: cytochrome P450 [Alphaproteobacteria bacterium]
MTTHSIESFAGCADALRKNDLRQALYDEGAVLMEKVLVNLHGSEHRERRQAEAKVFRKDFFHYYEKQVLPQTLQETIAPFVKAGKADLVDLGYRIMMNLTADFTGIDRPERSAEETGHLLRLLRSLGLAATVGQSKAEDKAPIKAQIKAAIDEFDARFFTPSIARRQKLLDDVAAGKADEDDLPRDVMTVLLQARDKLKLPRYDMLREAAFFSLAGAHTSIHSLSHAMHEIFEWVKKHPQDKTRLRDDPFFVQRCVHESLRLHPSSPIAKRRSLCPVHVEDAPDIATADEVVINLWAANRDPSMFGPDAAAFNPHRDIPKNQNPYGLSMGLGMHACLGRNLAVGVVPKAGADPETHHYGTVPLIVAALLRCGALPDPEDTPRKDETIARIMWAYYPIIFKPEDALL